MDIFAFTSCIKYDDQPLTSKFCSFYFKNKAHRRRYLMSKLVYYLVVGEVMGSILGQKHVSMSRDNAFAPKLAQQELVVSYFILYLSNILALGCD